jgi:SAM-dependent methyltransferase
MTNNFYDKVAKKFGGYHTPSKHIKEYPDQDPEKVFKEKLLQLSGKDKVALDVGCADGRFTLSVASYFQKIIAIDISEEMLKSAKNLQRKQKIINVIFEKQDAFATSYQSSFFDIVYNRRGPSNHNESYRLLKLGGYLIDITIGEKDCQEIKEIFKRGQGYGQWTESKLEKERQTLKKIGFAIIYSKDFFYTEYYPTYQDLDLFLQGVPIFEDFDSKKDEKLLKAYVDKFETDKGIKLPRHRVVLVAKKSD